MKAQAAVPVFLDQDAAEMLVDAMRDAREDPTVDDSDDHALALAVVKRLRKWDNVRFMDEGLANGDA